MNRGISLIELSVVLVIIAMMVSSAVGIKVLIRQSEVRSVLADVSEITTAVNNFQMQYDAMPGDFVQAHSYWSVAECPDKPPNFCSGDGDNIIEKGPDAEDIRVWQHLYLAGFYPDKLSGEVFSADPIFKVGYNIPESKIDGVGYSIANTNGSNSSLFYRSGHVIRMGKPHAMGLGFHVFTANEANSIDKKYDDGSPAGGKIIGVADTTGTPSAVQCLKNITDNSADYNMGEAVRGVCRLFFWYSV